MAERRTMKDDAGSFVHEYKGRWIVAQYRDGQYIAPHTEAARKLTGCTASFGSLAYVYGGNVYHNARRADALRRARDIYGIDCPHCGCLFVTDGPYPVLCPACTTKQKGE